MAAVDFICSRCRKLIDIYIDIDIIIIAIISIMDIMDIAIDVNIDIDIIE